MESTKGGMESSQSDVWNPHLCGMESAEGCMESVADGMKEKAIKKNATVVSRGVCSQ